MWEYLASVPLTVLHSRRTRWHIKDSTSQMKLAESAEHVRRANSAELYKIPESQT